MKTMTERKPWTYRGIVILPADRNGSGIVWTARSGEGAWLKAECKHSMRKLINRIRGIR
jgi:hypothetical protein